MGRNKSSQRSAAPLAASLLALAALAACNTESFGRAASYAQGKAPGFAHHHPAEAPSINQQFARGENAQGSVHEHLGIDFYQPRGTPVLAAAGGTVLESRSGPAYGHEIILAHGPLRTVYRHLSRRAVAKGSQVRRGQEIGAVGSTGLLAGGLNHLHFEVHEKGRRGFAAQDPNLFWRAGKGRPSCLRAGASGAGLTLPLPCKSAAKELQ